MVKEEGQTKELKKRSLHWHWMAGQIFFVEIFTMLPKRPTKAEMRKKAQAAEDITVLEMQHLVDKVCEEIEMAGSRMHARKRKASFDDGMDV